MILPFSTQLNGKPTYFVEKIQRSISKNLHNPHIDIKSEWFNSFIYFKVNPKLHTIREDKKDRWKPGTMIDFFINTRTKDMFRFAPRIPVLSTQEIEIIHHSKKYLKDDAFPGVYIDGNLMRYADVAKLSQNDGFDTVEDFFAYFNKDYTGKIIHWTDFRY